MDLAGAIGGRDAGSSPRLTNDIVKSEARRRRKHGFEPISSAVAPSYGNLTKNDSINLKK